MGNIFIKQRQKFAALKQLRTKKFASVTIVPKDQEKELLCSECGSRYLLSDWEKNYYVCPDCGHYQAMPASTRIRQLLDKGSFVESNASMVTKNPIEFPEYLSKIQSIQETTGLSDAAVTGMGTIGGIKVELVILDSRFMMGSMGTVVGEKVTLAIEEADAMKLPLIICCASGGARMQEGLFSLMQMAKTSAAIEKFEANGGFYLSLLTNPTMGGVSASFALLADIIIAEPAARIGFAGPRVIEQTIGQSLPDGFQHSEYLLEHGMIDMILERKKQKKTISYLLTIHSGNSKGA